MSPRSRGHRREQAASRNLMRSQRRPQSSLVAPSADAMSKRAGSETSPYSDTNCGGDEDWAPSARTVFKALLSVRMCAAIWNNVQDCDETFNYWEPLHRLLYGGAGLQTWEYSPRYALRSYTYLLLNALPASLYTSVLQSNRLLVFYFVRCVLAVVCAAGEVVLYGGVCRQLGPAVGRILLALLAGSAGMFAAAPALLPSSFAMVVGMMATGAWMRGHLPATVFAVGVASLIGWPFAVVLAVAPSIDFVVRQRRLAECVGWSLLTVLALLLLMLPIESAYYGRLVLPPLNIITYNVLSSTGANLYGTEPFSYYPLNLLLNFNLAFVFALAAVPLHLLAERVCDPASGRYHDDTRKRSCHRLPTLLLISPLYMYLAVFCWQAHKEERFLYPAYPALCVAAAVSLHALHRLWHLFRLRFLPSADVVIAGLLAVMVSVSVSRVIGQYRAYHAPMDAYMQLTRFAHVSTEQVQLPVTVCVGREWHRFPSSFFLPGSDWQLGFLVSAFDGQLPRYVSAEKTASGPSDDAGFNDRNRAEPGSHTPLQRCSFIVDVDRDSADPREPNYSADGANWSPVYSAPFLDPAGSHRLLRAFYVPFLTEYYCSYVNYNLLERKR